MTHFLNYTNNNHFDPDSAPYYSPTKDHRVALITGGNSGIGWYTALHLYLHGFIVYIAGRSPKRVEKAIKDIEQEAAIRRSASQKTDNSKPQTDEKQREEERPLGELRYLQLDLLDLKSIERAAEQFQHRERYLNLLILNAGVMALPHSITQDGFEIQVQTNYLAHVLLTQLLVGLLENAANDNGDNDTKINGTTDYNSSNNGGGDPRIVYLSSIGHQLYFWNFHPDSTFNYVPNILFTWLRYGMAKTFGIHYMKILALKYPLILSIAVHPGFVMNTNLFSYWTRLPIIGTLFWVFFQIFGWIFGVEIEQGSLATLKAALSPNLNRDNDNGKYFATGGVESQPSKIANNLTYAVNSYSWAIKQLQLQGFDFTSDKKVSTRGA